MRLMCNGYIIADSSYLSHHGILGMKWGKMNGPPYPLGSDDHSKAEKKAGWRKSLGPGRNEELYGRKNDAKVQNGSKKTNKKTESKSEHKGLTNGQKTAIKVAGVAIAAVGVAYLYKSGKLDSVIDAGKSYANKLLGDSGNTPLSDVSYTIKTEAPKVKAATITDNAKKIAEATGFKFKEHGMSMLNDAKCVNPNYDQGGKYQENCGFTAIGYCLRRMGLDVKIKDSWDETGFIPSNITDYFPKAKFPVVSKMDKSSVETIKKSISDSIIEKYGSVNGSCGMVAMNPGTSSAGHFMAWENVNGTIKFIDSQSGGEKSVDHYFARIINGKYKDNVQFNRLDDVIPDTNVIKDIFESR